MTLSDWIFNRREEARRLHLPGYRAWLAEGALVQPIYWLFAANDDGVKAA